jgi:hypothetical protein
MVKQQKSFKGRWLLLLVLAMASIVFTGCEKGSLGIKGGTATGLVVNDATDKPIPEVLVRASSAHQTLTTYTGGDGIYIFNDMTQGEWSLSIEKSGYTISNQTGTDTVSVEAAKVNVNNGETVTVPTIKLDALTDTYRGTLKGYPIDEITGRPLRNFTVSVIDPYKYRKSKKFELAEDFRDVGFTGLNGGTAMKFSITCQNYEENKLTSDSNPTGDIVIGKSATDLGVIKMKPLTLSIAGTLRNLPGYVLDAETRDIVIWAEAAGKVVASFTDTGAAGGGEAYKGSITYKLDGIPASAGSVAVKCKVRGYDLVTINPAVSIANNMPGGTIAAIDADFSNIEPIRRDLRVVVSGTEPDDEPSSFDPGDICRIYIQQGGKDIVPYIDVVSVNYRAEGYISGVITGYPINILAVNMSAGYHKVLSEPITVLEDGNSAYTVHVTLE